MPSTNTRRSDKGTRKQRATLTDEQSKRRQQGYLNKRVRAEQTAKAAFVGLFEGRGKKRRNDETNADFDDSFLEGSADTDVVNCENSEESEEDEDEDNRKPAAVVPVIFFNQTSPVVIDRCTTCPIIDIDDEDDDDDEKDLLEGSDEEPPPILNDSVFCKDRVDVWGDEPQVGVSQRYEWRFQRRLQIECSKIFPAFETKWLLDKLRRDKYCILQKDAPEIATKLGLVVGHYSYYPDIHVWLPDIRWGTECMPCCPNCKCSSNVKPHAFRANHPGRIVVGEERNAFAITRRYICGKCKEKRGQLKENIEAVAASSGVQVIVGEIQLKYTFMAWNPACMPLYPFGRGDLFPVFMTWKAAISRSLIDWMRPLYDCGVKPHRFAKIVKERHIKLHTRFHLEYEMEFKCERRLDPGLTRPEYSTFGNVLGYNGAVPTGKYFQHCYLTYHDMIRPFFDNEIKKRDADSIHWDVSYKEAKLLCKLRGEAIHHGLVTGLNQYNEIRFQFHIYTDGHNQMISALNAYTLTLNAYGMDSIHVFFTDDPTRDKRFFTSHLPSLQSFQDKLNSNSAITHDPLLPEPDYDSQLVTVCRSVPEINASVSAMASHMDTDKIVGLDLEWKPSYRKGGGGGDRVAVMQLSYVDTDGSMRVLIILLYQLRSLPTQLQSFLFDETYTFVGVNVTGDFHKIGRDFDISNKTTRRIKHNVTNLGKYARERDIVQNGSIGLEKICKIVLLMSIDKSNQLRFSDWTAKILSTDQIKYASLDAIVSRMIYMKLRELPNLTTRLMQSDVKVGILVDIVPQNGSVACMATRAGTGTVVGEGICISPDGVSPDNIQCGMGYVIVKVDTVYSTGLHMPNYKNAFGAKATLQDFVNAHVALPLLMLKKHSSSTDIRVTPSLGDENGTGRTQAAQTVRVEIRGQIELNNASIVEGNDKDSNDDNDNDSGGGSDHGSNHSNGGSGQSIDINIGEELNDDNALIDDVIDSFELSENDIKIIRASINVVSNSTEGQRIPLQCSWLKDPPNKIVKKYSSVLGDVFHAIQRTYTPKLHEYRKAYYVALREAFLEWDLEVLNELKDRMKGDGMSDNDIDSMMYHNPLMFKRCVPRIAPSSDRLYYRVRAVYIMYCEMIDSKTKQPLFNEAAKKKARRVLEEIENGFYSDPPGVNMYTEITTPSGALKTNKYGMAEIECRRGTNGTEAVHRKIHYTFAGWQTGPRMADALLAEFRHRHNIVCAELRREGYPVDMPIDTWMIDALQNLYFDNRHARLYPSVSNTSEYKQTEESFGNIALHSEELHDAILSRWATIDQVKVKLTANQKHLSVTAGIPLPFQPFITVEENKQYAACVLDHSFPKNDEDAAIRWCELYVDGVNIWPKLPVHMRNHREKFLRGQRVRHANEAGRHGNEMLRQLNGAVASSKGSITIQKPAPLLDPKPQALRVEEYIVVGGMGVGRIPYPEPSESPHTRKGKQDLKQRAVRSCIKCKRNNCKFSQSCRGRAAKGSCQFYIEVSNNPVKDEAITCKLCVKYDGSGESCQGYDEKQKKRVCLKFHGHDSSKA